MKRFVRAARHLAWAAACLASVSTASASSWQMDGFQYAMGGDPAAGSFFDNGTTFSDWSIETPFTMDYVGYHYTPETSTIRLITDTYVFIARNLYPGACGLDQGTSWSATNRDSQCLMLERPVSTPGGWVGSILEWCVTPTDLRQSRAIAGTYVSAPIPEPATSAMLLLGGGLLAWTRRRRAR